MAQNSALYIIELIGTATAQIPVKDGMKQGGWVSACCAMALTPLLTVGCFV